MAKTQYRSRSWKRTASRRAHTIKMLYEKRRVGKSRCECGRFILGVRASGSKSDKKVNRKYGGRLCSKCMRKFLVEEWRKSAK